MLSWPKSHWTKKCSCNRIRLLVRNHFYCVLICIRHPRLHVHTDPFANHHGKSITSAESSLKQMELMARWKQPVSHYNPVHKLLSCYGMLRLERSHTKTRAVTGMHDRTSRLMEWGNKAERGAKGKLNNHCSNRPMKCPVHAEAGFMRVPHTQTHTHAIMLNNQAKEHIFTAIQLFFFNPFSFFLSHTHT